MIQKTLNKEEFQSKLNNVVRFWDEDKQEALSHNQASDELKQSCVYIFLRNDGWSIASPYYGPAYKLWTEEWAFCYELKQTPSITKDALEKFFSEIDFKLLKQQKAELIELQGKLKLYGPERFNGSVQGIIHLLDYVQDEAYNTGNFTEEEIYS